MSPQIASLDYVAGDCALELDGVELDCGICELERASLLDETSIGAPGLESLHAETIKDAAAIADSVNPHLFKCIFFPPFLNISYLE
jgi:hypothetical protein